MDLGLKGRIALITGAAGGIGAATADRLAREGCAIVIVDRDGPRGAETAAALRDHGVETLSLEADVADKASVDRMTAEALEKFGRIDILVNNAGFQRDMRLGKMEEAEWDSVVDVILKGAYLCTRAVLQPMIENRWGRVVNMSSRAHLGNAGQANYSAAKAGLLGFTRALSLENGKFGVTFNAVAPGIVDTPAIKALPHYDAVRANAEKTTPVPRMGTVEDVADAVAFLASERASYINGEVLHVTGGRY